jgi:hypothetical protein
MMPVIPLSKLHPVTTQSRSIRRQREPSAGLGLSRPPGDGSSFHNPTSSGRRPLFRKPGSNNRSEVEAFRKPGSKPTRRQDSRTPWRVQRPQ